MNPQVGLLFAVSVCAGPDQGPGRAAQAPKSLFIIQQPQQRAVRGRQQQGGSESKENIWKMTLNAPHHSWAWLKGGLLWGTGESCRAPFIQAMCMKPGHQLSSQMLCSLVHLLLSFILTACFMQYSHSNTMRHTQRAPHWVQYITAVLQVKCVGFCCPKSIQPHASAQNPRRKSLLLPPCSENAPVKLVEPVTAG